ncbi:MAG: hypothetical protein ABEK02_02515 [Haloquadratum sp.]
MPERERLLAIGSSMLVAWAVLTVALNLVGIRPTTLVVQAWSVLLLGSTGTALYFEADPA